MIVLGVDPGSEKSAYVVYNSETMNLGDFGKVYNRQLLRLLPVFARESKTMCMCMPIEMPASFGMPVGYTVLETCRWVGIFQHAFGGDDFDDKGPMVYRKKRNEALGLECTCMHLCKSTRAKDSNIIKAISERFPHTGGGKNPVKGTKAQPGPLFGIAADVWQALGVAITYTDQIERRCF